MTSYLAYYKYADYTDCPLRYKWRYVDDRLPTEPDRPLKKILGIVWNDMLEVFYRDKKFMLGSGCTAWMAEKVTAAFRSRVIDLQVVWEKSDQEQEYLAEALAVVPKILTTLKQERLLGEKIEVEKTMYASLPSGNRIGGRLDLLLDRKKKVKADEAPAVEPPAVESLIVDFKGTKNEKYVDSRQLLWYGLLYQGLAQKFPDYLGFWLLRFACVKWVSATKTEVQKFISSIEDTFKGIQASKFEATPRPKACRWCQYKSGCDHWTKYQAEHRRPSTLSEESDELSEVLYV